ncbi:MAG TPA: hypothetical protein VGJ26_09770 [Pirellulales bacterium]
MIISTFLRGGWGKMTRLKLPAVLAAVAGNTISTPADDTCHSSLPERLLGGLTKYLPK